MAELEGKTLDHYELRKLIGRGGMADVYEGYDRYFQREVAVKIFKREDDELLHRFIREANVMASLSNEHLVPIYGSGECQVDSVIQYYIVMPFMKGGTLRARIRRAPLSSAEACECLQEIAEGLDYIHSQGVIHRDIKSSNVLLDADGRYYLSDFGIARTIADVTQLTSTGNVLGTVDYIAPELFEGDRKADALSDLYSLGVLLFEMVTGRLPFRATNQIAVVTMHVNKPPPSPRSINKNISPQVERVIIKALEKKPERRYQSALELADAFCSAIAAGNTRGVEEAETVESITEAETIPDVPAPLILRPAVKPAPPEMPPLTPLVKVGGSGRPLEDRPVAGRPQGRSRSTNPARQRTVVVTILALLILLVLAIPAIYAATHRSSFAPGTTGATSTTGTTNTTPAQIATTPAGTQSSGTAATSTPNATPDLTATSQASAARNQATATAQAAAAATSQASAAQDQATATAQAAAVATSQAQDQATATAQATATVVAGVTATAQASATAQAVATVGVLQTATAATPIYQDTLTDVTNSSTVAANWDQNSHCTFMSDGYHVMEGVNLVGLRGCRESANTYDNVTVSVDVRILSGHSGGLFFRVGVDPLNNYSGYLFEIDSEGNYKISNFSSKSYPLQNWTASSALNTGNAAMNTLLVVARGSTLFFYANGVFLTQVNDNTYASGYIAFLATSTNTSADVVYSNLKVYSLP